MELATASSITDPEQFTLTGEPSDEYKLATRRALLRPLSLRDHQSAARCAEMMRSLIPGIIEHRVNRVNLALAEHRLADAEADIEALQETLAKFAPYVLPRLLAIAAQSVESFKRIRWADERDTIDEPGADE